MGDLSRLTFNAPPPKPEAQPVRHPVGAALRMIRWGWVLARHDALIPREANPCCPPGAAPSRN
ncbi:hypothetical protein [Brevundimonas naejangsanensis]|uniref:hypothetical protein n=1 Tax=Brevundimonas naejangsanensis TaxID=588932 RepID=UPI001F0926BE|nr:hypothetical protein [Brevundimonas naejangsanensis]